MNREKLENLIKDFSLENLDKFLFDANFEKEVQDLEHICHSREDGNPVSLNSQYSNSKNIFSAVQKLGEIQTDDKKKIIVAVAKVRNDLSERSSRKKQYDLGKKILTNHSRCEAGIFVFYDKQSSFRFSLIYPTYSETKRVLNSFKRYTYFVSKEQTNKTFLNQIGNGDFSSLENIKDAFSVEKVTKEFFGKISNWYFWAIKEIKFPEDAEKDKDGKNSIGVIRLITRIIFIWFMEKKKLVPDYLFNEDKVKEFLKDLSPEKTIYYKAILQNLFFATLNTPIKKRGFRENENFQGKNKDFMNHNIYRYENYFKNQNEILKIFKNIPFLNGGLFECLDKETENNNKKKYLRIDGFSDRDDNVLQAPDFLFFSKEREVDLNCDYGTKNKKYKVQGLINILQSYNFTVDENTLIDEEVALDPEMLGMVFENLLASYNPETSTTARKATGSYYTPRKIVDYMVDESLKAYFKNKLPVVEKIDAKLNNLFSYSDENHQFSNNEVDVLIKAINELKVIDPAVGSGAFPMGILQKLVFVLSKLDPHNKKWKQEQINAVENNVSDTVLKKELIKKIESNFENNNLDYGRKLYLIQNCIYGVDIQITAIQISKLRFFISLLVDEKSNESRENFGIEPLPNLETKFVAANSLIGLHSSGAVMLPDPRILKLEENLKKIRAKHFNANYKSEKERLRKKDKEIRLQLAELFEQSGFPSENTEKIINWDPYSPNTSANFFDSEWMFGIKDFDVVIANPPYGFRNVLTAEEKKYFRKEENIEFSSGDSAELFCKKCFDILLKNDGFLTLIIPKKSLYGDAWEGLRKEYWNKYCLTFLMDSSKAFENVLLEQSIFGLSKNRQDKKVKVAYLDKNNQIIEFAKIEKDKIFMENYTAQIYKELYPEIFKKISKNKIKEILVKGDLGLAIGTNFFSDKPTKYKLLKGIDIDKWRIKQNRYLKNEDKLKTEELNKFSKPKVICQRLIAHIENPIPHVKITACYDADGIAITNTLTSFKIDKRLDEKFWLAYLNSNFASWYAYNFIYSRAIRGMDFYNFYIQQIPIPKKIIEQPEQQKPFINLVDQILKNKKDNPEADTGELERKIDEMVYGLYELSKEEIATIKGN